MVEKFEVEGPVSKHGVVLGAGLGEDAAALDCGSPASYLVAKTDPITFATEELGYYAVHVNANDVATRGARPKWFMATLLLPEGATTPKLVERVCDDVKAACDALGVVVVGGHTEVTHGLDRPIVVGVMLGEVPKGRLVRTSGARPGDAVVVTKGVPIEGAAVIALEKERELLAAGVDRTAVEKAKGYLHDPGISVVREALLAAEEFDVHSMHDPTEGGLAQGLHEVCEAAGVGIEVDLDSVPVLPEAALLCRHYGLDPLGTLASGALVVTLAEAQAPHLVERLEEERVNAVVLGRVVEKGGLVGTRGGTNGPRRFPIPHSEVDQLTKIFEKES